MGVRVREKNPGEWWLFISHNGKRTCKKVGKDKKLAFEAAKQIQARLVLGDVGIVDKDSVNVPTFKEYVRGWTDSEGHHIGWFDKVALLSLKNSTRTGYEQILTAHLFPTFGDVRLDEITSRNIGDFIYSRFKKGLRSTDYKEDEKLFECHSAPCQRYRWLHQQ